jgi:pimeloyl-ACP methyl ester carboxylesterase
MTDVELITVRDGRRVALRVLADGGADRTVVFCHPAPGAGTLDPDPEATHSRGIRLIAVDRPGYGGSDPVTGDQWATVDSAADDVAVVLDRLGVNGPVGVAGWSAGGRVALALAARRPDLVDRVVVIGTPAPDDQVPWVPEDYRQGMAAMRDLPPTAVHEALAAQLAPMAEARGDAALGLLGAGDVDAAALVRPGARPALAEMLEAAFAQGAAGMAADIAGYMMRPWGFDPTEVSAKTLLVYAAQDPLAGPRHGKWWQRHLPSARYEQSPTHGHLVALPAWSRVLSHLAPRVTAPRRPKLD